MPYRTRLDETFDAIALQFPDVVAVVAPDRTLTYRELAQWSSCVAAQLRANGVRRGDFVGLVADRSADMIAGILGILKAGSAYVPIDPAYPRERIQFLTADSGVSVVATVQRVAESLKDWQGTRVYIDEADRVVVANRAPQPAVAPSNREEIAYVIYTSGSSGTPKGVMVEHASVLRLFEATQPSFRFDHTDVWTSFHSASFDFSVWEIWGALLHGGRLVIVPSVMVTIPDLFCELLLREKITVLNQTPSAFRQLAGCLMKRPDARDLRLRFIIFGGEALFPPVLQLWMNKFGDQNPSLVNMYGITEITVHATWKHLRADDLDLRSISPIGTPIPGTSIYLLDADGVSVEDGTPGEIYVAGPGVARGYLNRPELTKERFPILPAVAGDRRLYRSGDLAVKSTNGEYIYRGRVDDQFKVRGFRVEPGEIEACLMRHPRVSVVVVLPHDGEDGDVHIHAYFVPHSPESVTDQEADQIARDLEHYAAALPQYMRPTTYSMVMAIPLTPHGKTDRKVLRLSAAAGMGTLSGSADLSSPSTSTTDNPVAVIAGICGEVLKRRIGPDDDIFDIGGTSLAFAHILTRVNQCFGTVLNGSELDGLATPAKIADCVLSFKTQI
jgi:amino acid adenylation domain-containing protein